MSSEEYALPITSPTISKFPKQTSSLSEIIIPRKRMRLVDLTVDIPSSSRTTSVPNENAKSPSRWRTLEFKFYYAVFILVIPIMIWIPVSLSRELHPNYPFYKERLSPGWIFGRAIDNSDAQYRSFRNNIPVLTAVASILFIVKVLWNRTQAITAHSTKDHLHFIPFNLFCSLLFLSGLHGTSLIKIIIILSANYLIGKRCQGSKLGPALTWVFNALVLFSNDRYNGYSFGHLSPWLVALDAYKGFYPRWHISFNITMLRLISFNMDYHWSCRGTGSAESGNSTNLNERQRQTVPHPREFYSYVNYLSYALYSPLYIAGPIITFNDFLWQYRQPVHINRPTIFRYLVRFLACLLTMEFILHFMYVVAIKDKKAWGGDSPAEIAMIGFWNLMIVWLKLLIPWRFFRLWALADGIDPPENMVRCMANNYSPFGFWRSWHRSFNLWIIRYIYIPIGGMKNVFVNSVLVFTFVALWHDLTFKLLAWGWLVSLFIVPEMVARFLLPPSRFGAKPWYRHLCAFGAVSNILMMMAANLVGFVIGIDGIEYFMDQLLGTVSGWRFLAGAVGCLFVGAQVMFEYREDEIRNGIYRKC